MSSSRCFLSPLCTGSNLAPSIELSSIHSTHTHACLNTHTVVCVHIPHTHSVIYTLSPTTKILIPFLTHNQSPSNLPHTLSLSPQDVNHLPKHTYIFTMPMTSLARAHTQTQSPSSIATHTFIFPMPMAPIAHTHTLSPQLPHTLAPVHVNYLLMHTYIFPMPTTSI